MELLAQGDAHRTEAAEERVTQCAQRLRRAALMVDRVLVERRDEDGRRRLVEGALRLTGGVERFRGPPRRGLSGTVHQSLPTTLASLGAAWCLCPYASGTLDLREAILRVGCFRIMRPRGSAAELEHRRRRAARLLKSGHTLSAVARMVGVTVSAVWQWREMVRRLGPVGLAAKPAPGRRPKLTARERARLPKLLAEGARRYGYRNDRWTLRRVAAAIELEFGVTYHRAHVGRLLAALGWSCQKPARRAVERHEAAIEHWRRYRRGTIEKSPAFYGVSGIPRRKWFPPDPHGVRRS
jgi:transposase